MAIEVLPLNVVNMLQQIAKSTNASVEMTSNNFNNIQLEEKFSERARILPLQSIHPSFKDCNYDSMSEEGLSGSKEEESFDPLWVLPTKNI